MNIKKVALYVSIAAGAAYLWKTYGSNVSDKLASSSGTGYTDQNGTKNPLVQYYTQVRTYFGF